MIRFVITRVVMWIAIVAGVFLFWDTVAAIRRDSQIAEQMPFLTLMVLPFALEQLRNLWSLKPSKNHSKGTCDGRMPANWSRGDGRAKVQRQKRGTGSRR